MGRCPRRAAMLNSSPDLAYLSACLLGAGAGAACDAASRRVPNLVSLPAALAGLALHFALGGWRQLASSLAAGMLCFGLFLAFHLAGGMGAGDVKLIAAAGCLAGLPHVASLLLGTALAGGSMAICLALYRRRLIQTMSNLGALFVHHRTAGLRPHPGLNIASAGAVRLPYAVAIAAGAAWTLCSFLVGR